MEKSQNDDKYIIALKNELEKLKIQNNRASKDREREKEKDKEKEKEITIKQHEPSDVSLNSWYNMSKFIIIFFRNMKYYY